LYGQGEGDGELHPLFKAAWEGDEPLPIFGDGTNRLPTLHVRDLAAFAESVVRQQPQGSRYLLAADDALVTQAELVSAVGSLLGNKQTQ
jgi:adenylate kinase